MKDYTGNSKSIFTTLGASSHSIGERESNDYYATEPKATELLLEVENFSEVVYEPACGEGHMAKVLEDHGHIVIASDLIDRGYGTGGVDFLNYEGIMDFDIITNPPYKFAKEFVYKALESITDGHKVAMFLKLQFLEGKERKKLFMKYPPKTVYVSSSRLSCAKNGDFKTYSDSAVAYAWYVWEKGYSGDTIIKWIN
ncbi:MAG: NAD(P)-dependent oxidoreductase [Lachnospiraceae bacterium]|nr:NAD(P)-dependent oxidoreductase [Lachnospiraceae bacterium]